MGKEEVRVKYLLVENKCYELIVDFRLLMFSLSELDPNTSTKDIPREMDCVLSSNFSILQFVTYEDLLDFDRNLLVGISLTISKQFLQFKYKGNSPYPPAIPVIDTYERAFEKWDRNVTKQGKEIKECKLENVVLEEETKEDKSRTINFIKNMKKYKDIGCTLPSGVLLEGEPGTGKTLISKTIAHESNMNFKHVVGSDFVEKYVGESAKHVEKVFKELKDKGGGVLFIDEIDAIGGKRDSSDDNKEYRSCLNKLLACMSDASENNIIVIGATNVKEQLDPALIREGRFDLIINIPLPNFESRVKLFELYVGKLKHEENIDYELLAEKSEGKSGAFISSVCNHSGILAVDRGFQKVNQEHLEQAIDKMLRDNKSENNNNIIGFVK